MLLSNLIPPHQTHSANLQRIHSISSSHLFTSVCYHVPVCPLHLCSHWLFSFSHTINLPSKPFIISPEVCQYSLTPTLIWPFFQPLHLHLDLWLLSLVLLQITRTPSHLHYLYSFTDFLYMPIFLSSSSCTLSSHMSALFP